MFQRTMDGNEAAAYVSYAFTEVAAIYPITPSSPMAEHVDRWAAVGKTNIFGQTVKLVEMQSEAGAVSAMHGALDSGALSSTYTSSQGMMLMIPTMYRIAGQLKPGVIHVASRNVATHAISIFAEHSDAMACRQSGFALLASSSVQQAMDLGAVAHLSAIRGSIPFLHFFDGFRTSHEVQKVNCLEYTDLRDLTDMQALAAFRKRALNPEHPVLRTTGMNSDTYFQSREASNGHYDRLPEVVQAYMDEINRLTGQNYRLFDYYGARDAERVLVGMGSIAGTVMETVDYLVAQGEKVGYMDVHLYRPFSASHFLAALPASVRRITVLDRTKEPGAVGEPLYEDICSVLHERRKDTDALACRYGLASKDTTPAQIVAIFENMQQNDPRNHFTVGITDDVTHLSLPAGAPIDTGAPSTTSCKFWGLGSDGTVGANKNTIKIIGDHTPLHVQAYFEYDGKKSGGVTRSHLRFGESPIRSTYLVTNADFVACHNKSYVSSYDLIADLKPGGKLLLACDWSAEELETRLPAAMRRAIAQKQIRLFTIDAEHIAQALGLGNRTNIILQAAFFAIADIIPLADAARYMQDAIRTTYGHKGEKVVALNEAAIEKGIHGYVACTIPPHWATLPDTPAQQGTGKPRFISHILEPVNAMQGDSVPVSEFLPHADGTMPAGTSAYEKRGVAFSVPEWRPAACLQCNQCAYVCPHAAIRPYLLTKQELSAALLPLKTATPKGKGQDGLQFTIQVSALDCQGCGSCAAVCPAKEKALEMKPLDTQGDAIDAWMYTAALPEVRNPLGVDTVKGSQFAEPLLAFPGACAGCGETPYAKLVTQLFGSRMYIATATGCAQVWASSFPCFPYCKNKQGFGPAVAGSLFENNAEFGLGIRLGALYQRQQLREQVGALVQQTADPALKRVAETWLAQYDDADQSIAASDALEATLSAYQGTEAERDALAYIRANTEHLRKKSFWMFGGDGWAYDIGYGGLDHVLASGENVNVLVFDTEVYSNTGGQASKATPAGAVAQFAASGKKTQKKDLGMMAMSYRNVYVAQVAMGANQGQLLKALREAEAYDGPSLIIAYAPCINHGLRRGMANVQDEMRQAVNTGYWHLYRYDPRKLAAGENPFTLDSPAPTGDMRDFMRGEVRYASLEQAFPEEATRLFAKTVADSQARYQQYRALAEKNHS